MKRILVTMEITTLGACQQSSQSSTENNLEATSNTIRGADAHADSLEDLADKMRDESSKSESSVSVKFIGGWSANKELTTVRRVMLENTTDRKVAGVKLAYGTGMSKEFDDRNVGKFKVAIKPHGRTVLQIQAKRFGVSDDVIENPSYTSLMFHDSIAVSVVYFSDGTTRVD